MVARRAHNPKVVGTLCNRPDLFDGAYRRAAEFLYNEGHSMFLIPVTASPLAILKAVNSLSLVVPIPTVSLIPAVPKLQILIKAFVNLGFLTFYSYKLTV